MEQMQFLFVKGAALSYGRAGTISLLVVVFTKRKMVSCAQYDVVCHAIMLLQCSWS
jgi:hypothetical protein